MLILQVSVFLAFQLITRLFALIIHAEIFYNLVFLVKIKSNLVVPNILLLTTSKIISAKSIPNANTNSSVFKGQTNGLFNFAFWPIRTTNTTGLRSELIAKKS